MHFKVEVICCIKCSVLKEAFLPVFGAQQFPNTFQQTLQGKQFIPVQPHKYKSLKEAKGCACKAHGDIRFRAATGAKLG